MFKKPEELIMAVLAALWVVLTYFLTRHAGMPFIHTGLVIVLATILWAAVFFLLWQRHYTHWLWPLFLGLLVVCWWPAVTWYAWKDVIVPGMDMSTVIVNLPWYATWTAKIIYALIPVAAGYAFKWRRHRKNHPSSPSQAA